MPKAKNKWGAALSGFMHIECCECSEKQEAEVLDGRILLPDLYWVAVPYNGDKNHLEPVCWECAMAELQAKTIDEIQRETAYTWAYRAWAAKQLGFVLDVPSYSDEAIEHAALSGDDQVLANARTIISGE